MGSCPAPRQLSGGGRVVNESPHLTQTCGCVAGRQSGACTQVYKTFSPLEPNPGDKIPFHHSLFVGSTTKTGIWLLLSCQPVLRTTLPMAMELVVAALRKALSKVLWWLMQAGCFLEKLGCSLTVWSATPQPQDARAVQACFVMLLHGKTACW